MLLVSFTRYFFICSFIDQILPSLFNADCPFSYYHKNFEVIKHLNFTVIREVTSVNCSLSLHTSLCGGGP